MPETCIEQIQPGVAAVGAIPATREYGDSALQKILALPVVMAGLLVSLTFCVCSMRFSDPDTWWHLKAGQVIWNTHSIPRADQWSFTAYGHPWIAHEWLSQFCMYTVWRFFGYPGLQLWLCLLAGAIVAAVYLLSYRYCGDATIAALGGFLAFLFGTIGFSLRPQLLAYFLLALELLLLQRGFSSKPRALWWLPPLFLVWINCHPSYPLGLAIFGAALACRLWNLRGKALRSAFEFVNPFLASCAALALNPFGLKMLFYPFDLLFRQKDNLAFIDEWFPPNPQASQGLALVIVLAAIGIAGLTGRARLSVFELLVFVPVTFFAIQHRRMLFVFGIVAAPLVCRMLTDYLGPRKPQRDHLPSNAVLLLTASLLCVAMFPRPENIEANIEAANPVKAVRFIREAGLQGPMLNDYGWGGYLIWEMPEHKTFVDGRADIFDWTGVLAEYRRWVGGTVDPAPMLDKYRIGFCLFPVEGIPATLLRRLPGWKQVYSDRIAAVFVRQPVPSTPTDPRRSPAPATLAQ